MPKISKRAASNVARALDRRAKQVGKWVGAKNNSVSTHLKDAGNKLRATKNSSLISSVKNSKLLSNGPKKARSKLAYGINKGKQALVDEYFDIGQKAPKIARGTPTSTGETLKKHSKTVNYRQIGYK